VTPSKKKKVWKKSFKEVLKCALFFFFFLIIFSNLILSPIFTIDAQFHDFVPTYGDFLNNQKLGMKLRHGMGWSMGLYK